MVLINLFSLFFVKYLIFIYCSDSEYKTITKNPIHNVTLNKDNKFIIKNKFKQILLMDNQTINETTKYFILPLFENGLYVYQGVENT